MALAKAVRKACWVFVITAAACAQDSASAPLAIHQSLDDAWWTGPMLAPSAATLPRGHFLIEPYFYDVALQGRYDANGVRRSTTHANGFGSLTYILYGVANRFTVGLIPTGGFNLVSGAPSSSGLKLGDVTLQGEYRLAQFQEGRRIPTVSAALQETLPTGKYDRLGDRMSNGLGGGAYTTTLALYSQMPLWLPNGRILRMRLNFTQSFSREVTLKDASVYGTEDGFRGHADPGPSTYFDAAWEYSLRRRWVAAFDATYRHDGNTHVSGYNVLSAASSAETIRTNSGTGDTFALAPAIEYSWKRNLGVLLGVRLIPAGRNTAATITPAVAINYVH